MSRRTETAYKAKSQDKSAQHDKIPDSWRYGKCCGCVEKDHALIRGDLSDLLSRNVTALSMATWSVIRQKSAESIVGVGRQSLCSGIVWKRATQNSWRTHPTEGPNMKRGDE